MTPVTTDMKRGQCPKCGGEGVRLLRCSTHRNWLPLDWLYRSVRINNLICASCGYVEDDVRQKDLLKLAEKVPNVRDVH